MRKWDPPKRLDVGINADPKHSEAIQAVWIVIFAAKAGILGIVFVVYV